MLAQGAPGVLVQLFHLCRDLIARQDAHRLGQPERKAAGQAGQRLIPGQRQQRFKLRGDLAVDEMLQPAADLFHHLWPGFVIDKGLDARLGRFAALDQLAHRMAAPHQAALFSEIKLGVGRVVEAVGAQVKLRSQRLDGGLGQGARGIGRGAGILPEAEPFQTAGKFAFHRHFALVVDLGHESLLLLQPAKQDACPPVDKSLRQRRMQRIRQPVFYSAGFVAPMGFVFHPVFPLGDVGPCPNIRQSA